MDEIEKAVDAILDKALFRKWMAENVDTFELRPFEIRQLKGGSSNLTLIVSQEDRHWVIRRPPMGKFLPSAHDMSREYGFYAALKETCVPVPKTYGLNTDEAILGAPFYAMEFVPGTIFEKDEDLGAVDLVTRRAYCENLTKTLAAIHKVDVDTVGLGNMAKAEGYLERQVGRWTGNWDKIGDGDAVISEVAARLKRIMPETSKATIVHGDYRIGNLMVSERQKDKIVAVLDWEMATIGDPLSDLGYLLSTWGDDVKFLDPTFRIPRLDGFMKKDEIISVYQSESGSNVDNIDYYLVLAWFKLAILCQGHYHRISTSDQNSSGPWSLDQLRNNRDEAAQFALMVADRSSMAILNGR